MPGGQEEELSPNLVAALIEARPLCIFGTGRCVDVHPTANRIDVEQESPRNQICRGCR
jgi:hypothetical protein